MGWDGKHKSQMWLLKPVGCIVCPIIVCDGNNCSEVVVGLCGYSCPFDHFWE